MPIRFEWVSPEKRVMRYVIAGDWNWHEYHRVVRVSIFQMMNHPEGCVHSLIDLRDSATTFPAGVQAHARTFGKRYTPALSGRVIVLGMPDRMKAQLRLENDTLTTPDGVAYFVDTLEAVQALLEQW